MSNENNVYGNVYQFGPSNGGGGVTVAKEDVRFGVPATDGTGLLVSPAESNVREGITYGSNDEYTGTLVVDDDQNLGGVGQIFAPVRLDGSLASPLTIGDTYADETNKSFNWTLDKPTGMGLGNTVATLSFGLEECTPDYTYTGTVSELAGNANIWVVSVEIQSTETALHAHGLHFWKLTLTDGALVVTPRDGVVDWVCVG